MTWTIFRWTVYVSMSRLRVAPDRVPELVAAVKLEALEHLHTFTVVAR